MGVTHAAIWVSDMDAAKQFFVEGVGLEVNWSFVLDGIENVYVGGTDGEIQLRHDPTRNVPAATRENLDHLAIGVDDVDSQYKRIIEEGDCTEVEPPRTVDEAGKRVGFLRGIDGYIIELVEDI